MKFPPVPLEKIVGLPCIHREVVPEAYKDENGHMNVRYYMSIFDDAGYGMVASFGLTLDYHAHHHTGGFDLEHHVHYLKEVHIGDSVAVYFRLVKRSEKRIHYLMFMVNETRGTLASVFECVNSFADLRHRKTAPYPPEIATQIDAIWATHSALDWDAPVCGVMQA